MRSLGGLSVAPRFNIPFRWITRISSTHEDWPFGKPEGARLRIADTLKGPSVYRFAFYNHEHKLCQAYIGETECLHRRCCNYMKPLVPKNCDRPPRSEKERIKRLWRSYAISKLRAKLAHPTSFNLIELQILEVGWFQLNDVEICQEKLSDPFARKFLENLTILDDGSKGIRLINCGQDTHLKRFAKNLKDNRSKRVNATQE